MMSQITTKNITLATDPGEEVDDFIAFSRAIELYDDTTNISVIVSGGKISPQDRMKLLNRYIKESYSDSFTLAIGSEVVFRTKGAKFTFYADGDVSSLPEIDTFIGNGPLNCTSLDAVSSAMKECSNAFLIGGRKVGGVNQAGTNPTGVVNNWTQFIAALDLKKVNIVEMLPEQTRLIRFKKGDFKGEFIIKMAMRTTLMFMVSRPTIPPNYGDFDLHVRLNESNAQLCEIWKEEMNMVYSTDAIRMGKESVKEYVYTLKAMGHISSKENWYRLENLAQKCLTMTYAFAEKVFGKPTEVYTKHRFGFLPVDKLQENPGGSFATDEMAQILSEKIQEHFVSFTPTYDVQSVEASIETDIGISQDIVVILDDSGSMDEMGKEPLETLNEFIKNQQAGGGCDTTFSLWMFNSTVRKIIDDVKLCDVEPITEYIPQYMTALNDAIGSAILCKLSKPKSDNVICLVITDGLENSSSLHTKAGIRDMIETCEKEKNWRFIFMGANQDVFKEGGNMGFDSARCTSYDQKTPGNLRRASNEVSDQVMNYRTRTLMSESAELVLENSAAPKLGLRQKTRVEVIKRNRRHSQSWF